MALFKKFPKIQRLNREVIVTEKIDGMTAGVHVTPVDNIEQWEGPFVKHVRLGDDEFIVQASSKTHLLSANPSAHHNFVGWVQENARDLVEGLGVGSHWGEWWGQGINRNYGLTENRWSLFNVSRWAESWHIHGDAIRRPLLENAEQRYAPMCCYVVPVLARGLPADSEDNAVEVAINDLVKNGSRAVPGFKKPEGIVVYWTKGNTLMKWSFGGDGTE